MAFLAHQTNMKVFNNLQTKYTIVGIVFGLLFPVFATLMEIVAWELELSWASIVTVQRSVRLLWIIDTAPFFLGALAWYAGNRGANLKTSLVEITQSNDRYQKLFEQSTDGIVLKELDGTIIDINPTALKLHGYTKGELVGKSSDILVPRERQRDYKNLIAKLEEEGNFVIETQRKRKDGKLFWAEIIVGLVEKKNRKVMLACIRDISIRKELEQERERQLLAQQEVNKLLEQKVEERTADLSKMNNMLEEKNRDLTDSIAYAQRLQRAILPTTEILKQHFPESFIMYEARDMVSGDFYWFHEVGDKLMVVVADCTGHGVPGAFMSILGVELLNRIVIEERVSDPGKVLVKLDRYLGKALKATDGEEIKDGMDVSICLIDKARKQLHFAGAASVLMYQTEFETTKIRGSRFGIGSGSVSSEKKQYETQVIDYEKGDEVFLFTDGYVDQFGGEKGRKMMIKGFIDILRSVRRIPAHMQSEKIHDAFYEWKGELPQIDDVTLLGLRL